VPNGGDATARPHGAADFSQQLQNPQTIQLGTKGTHTRLSPRKDYIIKLPRGRKRGHTIIQGGRNVLIDGGRIVMKGGGSDVERRAIYIKNVTGIVRIQNVTVRGRRNAAFDAIAISAPEAVVELINIRVEGVHGTFDGFHGDIVQPFGGVKRLFVDGLSGRTGYQGLYLVETNGRIGSVVLNNVDLSYLPNRQDRTTVMVWFDGCRSYPVTLQNVYIAPRKGQQVARDAVRTDDTCRAQQRGNKISWPKRSRINGTIIEGRPPGGTFVPAGDAR
jgi:hypothetical protein